MKQRGDGRTLGWIGIVRLGLVQSALGSIIVLMTSTLNRIMVVEIGLSTIIPGALVGLHYGVQIARPLWGHGSDKGGRRTPWIIGGVALLALAGIGAAISTAIMAENPVLGIVLAACDFVAIGFGVGAAGTSLLALLAASVAPERRPVAAMLVWLMMIFGIAVTALISGRFLDPFSMRRLIEVTTIAGLCAIVLTVAALAGLERPASGLAEDEARPASFAESFADVWSDPQARLFTIFVFVSMLAYSMQELILEPFAGLVFGMTPGETTSLSGLQNGGVFAGMLVAGVAGSLLSKAFPPILVCLTVAGCLVSGVALALLAFSAIEGPGWPLTQNVLLLGFANGVFAVAAIASMMALAGGGETPRVGMRMGLWGAAQALAFGLGGLSGTVAVDLMHRLTTSVPAAYGSVFLTEGLIFVAAAALAILVAGLRKRSQPSTDESAAGFFPVDIEGAK